MNRISSVENSFTRVRGERPVSFVSSHFSPKGREGRGSRYLTPKFFDRRSNEETKNDSDLADAFFFSELKAQKNNLGKWVDSTTEELAAGCCLLGWKSRAAVLWKYSGGKCLIRPNFEDLTDSTVILGNEVVNDRQEDMTAQRALESLGAKVGIDADAFVKSDGGGSADKYLEVSTCATSFEGDCGEMNMCNSSKGWEPAGVESFRSSLEADSLDLPIPSCSGCYKFLNDSARSIYLMRMSLKYMNGRQPQMNM